MEINFCKGGLFVLYLRLISNTLKDFIANFACPSETELLLRGKVSTEKIKFQLSIG